MKKFKRLLALVSVVLCMSMVLGMGSVAASGAGEQQLIGQPRVICITPGCTYFSALICDKSLVDTGTTTHKYDFWTKTCTITWYESKYLGFQCLGCGVWQMVGVDPTKSHDCLRTHSSCGKTEEYCRNDQVLPS